MCLTRRGNRLERHSSAPEEFTHPLHIGKAKTPRVSTSPPATRAVRLITTGVLHKILRRRTTHVDVHQLASRYHPRCGACRLGRSGAHRCQLTANIRPGHPGGRRRAVQR